MKKFWGNIHKGMEKFGKCISIIPNSVFLCIVYFLGVGITSLFAKLIGKKFLEIKILKNRDSYWSNLNLKKKELKEYYRQF